MNGLVRGGIAGLAATVPMTAVIFGGKAAGLLRDPSPKQVTGRMARKVGIPRRHRQKKFAFNTSWVAAHLGFGVGSGAVYGLLRGVLPGNAVVRGLLYGGGLWAIMYGAILPLLGLYPTPTEDSSSRRDVMIAAHGVFGFTLAELAQLLDQSE